MGAIENKQGKLLTTEKEQEGRWTEHFQEMLNRPPPDETADIPEAEEDLDIDIDAPTKEEIVAAIKTLKNGKSPGQGNLEAEMFKTDPEPAADILHPLFTAVWESEKVPDEGT